MKKLWPALICLSACALSSCVPGKVNNYARDDGYVFYIGSWRYTSKGKQLGCAIPEIELNGERVKIVRAPYAVYCADGAIYAVCETKVEGVHFLCYCRAGETVGIVLAQAPSYSISLPTGRNIYTKNVQVEFGDGKRRFLRDGAIVEINEGTLVCPEGDGRVVEKDGAAFYAEGDQRWELPGFAQITFLYGWTLCYRTHGNCYVTFDMKRKTATEIEGHHLFALDHSYFSWGQPFSIKEFNGKTVFCRWDGEGHAEERFAEIDFPWGFEYAGGDGVFRLSGTHQPNLDEWAYDYAFGRLTHCVEGKPSIYDGDFSYYEDESYRFYVKNTYESGRIYPPSYYRLNKKTGEDEFLYRPMETMVSGSSHTLFPNVDWVIAPEK